MMKNYGKYPIWLTGSHQTIYRSVYEDDGGKTFIKFYGQQVEVIHVSVGYATVLKY